MSFRWYLIFMGVGSGLAWAAWTMVLLTINPDEAGPAGLVFFYTTLLLALIGSLALFGLAYRVGLLKKADNLANEVRISFRHAVLLSVVAVASLLHASLAWFNWFWVALVVVAMAAIEYLFLLVQASKRQ